MNPEAIIGGAKVKLAPLISFNAIFDVDFGLAKLIKDEYLDPSVFNVEFFNHSSIDIIRDLYLRKEENPLYLFAKEDISKKKLDEFYQEFITSKRSEIYERCITTNILSLIGSFNETQEIIPIILYYNDEELRLLNDEPTLAKNKKVLLSTLSNKDKESFTQFFFKDLNEVIPFENLNRKTFYISTCGINLGEKEDDLKDLELIKRLIQKRNAISIFDIYKKDITERD